MERERTMIMNTQERLKSWAMKPPATGPIARPTQEPKVRGIKGAPDDDFLQDIASRAKERWDKHEKWCQHCGAPSRHDKLGKMHKMPY